MKLNTELDPKDSEGVITVAAEPMEKTNQPDVSVRFTIPEGFRRLKKNEMVSHGDFVANDRLEVEPWEGPGGFRAGAFVKPIYRRHERRSTAAKKLK